ncbi:uncharacterized protein HMPREF1541_05012 [Cyphellophora europaea CBS 101466]|uniref:DNA-directed RNA polymerase I subunit RPA49 n=1 Tax=Cyphellophora europaea (strain CBS 101466) TaxID=1220924 RepID=W2RWA9_CYPE1|nr:uncharacterized protein HMPREF1541_05012 [Cyphellophora europaea CBS 101466]ETN40732.1 hypothetical protein HMPREF1541_05012 [Cyphellophora europaea CBS 101466]
MSDRKRKAGSQGNPRPSKKPQTGTMVKVTHHKGPNIARPTIGKSTFDSVPGRCLTVPASCPGSSLPSNIKFETYATRSDPRVLLHSSDHDTIDFTAVETRTTSSTESHMKHYVAVYDPTTSHLTVMEARKVAARAQVRQFEKQTDDDHEENAAAPTPGYASRAALTEAFGTKKSKKAVQSIAENRLFALGGSDADPLSHAIHSTVAIDDDGDIDTQEPVRSNKPLPTANLNTEDIREVYPVSSLVFPSGLVTLESMPIAYWRDRASNNKAIKGLSNFVVNRIVPLLHVQKTTAPSETQAHARITQQIQLLRYLELLLQMHVYLARQSPRKRFPPAHQWPEGTVQREFDMSILKGVLDHFFPERTANANALTLLRSTILAISLHIPPAGRTPDTNTLVAEPTDIARDLALDREVVTKLYREVGCRIAPLSDTDMKVFNLDKLKGRTDGDGEPLNFKKVKFAKLKFPVEFPKVSQGRRERRR